jgi:hypothetical protein
MPLDALDIQAQHGHAQARLQAQTPCEVRENLA